MTACIPRVRQVPPCSPRARAARDPRRLRRGSGTAGGSPAPPCLAPGPWAAAGRAVGPVAGRRLGRLDLEQVLPPPHVVLRTLQDLVTSGDLWPNVAASMTRVLVGFAVGAALGLLLGTAMGLSRLASRPMCLPTFNALVQIPVLAWLPFVVLLVGIGETLKYILIAKAALVPVHVEYACRDFARRLQSLPGGRAASMATATRQEVLEIVLPHAPCRPCSPACGWASLFFFKAWLSLVVGRAGGHPAKAWATCSSTACQLVPAGPGRCAAAIVVGAIGPRHGRPRLLDAAQARVNRGPPGTAHCGRRLRN